MVKSTLKSFPCNIINDQYLRKCTSCKNPLFHLGNLETPVWDKKFACHVKDMPLSYSYRLSTYQKYLHHHRMTPLRLAPTIQESVVDRESSILVMPWRSITYYGGSKLSDINIVGEKCSILQKYTWRSSAKSYRPVDNIPKKSNPAFTKGKKCVLPSAPNSSVKILVKKTEKKGKSSESRSTRGANSTTKIDGKEAHIQAGNKEQAVDNDSIEKLNDGEMFLLENNDDNNLLNNEMKMDQRTIVLEANEPDNQCCSNDNDSSTVKID